MTVPPMQSNGSCIQSKQVNVEHDQLNASTKSAEARTTATTASKHAEYYALRHDYYYTLTIRGLARRDEGKYYCQYYCEECDSSRTELIVTGNVG